MNPRMGLPALVVCMAVLLASGFAAAQLRSGVGVDLLTPCTIPLDRPMRAVHIAGNWGTNPETVARWNRNRSKRLIPLDYVAHLRSLRINWVGISVALHYTDSMDSTVQRVYSPRVNIPTFSDRALRQIIREFRRHGFDVYLTVAFESHEAEAAERPVPNRGYLGAPGVPPGVQREHWPWARNHPEHTFFVRRFWHSYTREVLHFARIAQAEDVRMFSIGTETPNLFRTRAGGGYFVNDFAQQLRTLVERVRSVYEGLLTYNMHFIAITDDVYEPGSRYLWEDLDLDVVGVSAWFPLVDTPPDAVMSVGQLRREYERVFRDYVLPLADENTGRPIVFTEYGAIDTIAAPSEPARTERQGQRFVFSDTNGNGVDDGRETQANIFRAFFRTMDRYPGAVYGAFFWDNWIGSNEQWRRFWSGHRNFDIRNKPAGNVVRGQYRCYERR